MRNKRSLAGILLAVLIPAFCGGCSYRMTETPDLSEETNNTEHSKCRQEPEELIGNEDTEPEHPESKSEAATAAEIPQLPSSGDQLSDFVPEGWKIMDSVELDFNTDGMMDYVGVLEESKPYEGECSPRILFAIVCDGEGRYQLDFQDNNLIRTQEEGGVFGDPYLPLTAEDVSFTTYAYGGSNWRWIEAFTYTYKEGVWYLTYSEQKYGYWDYTTSDAIDDWEKGIGIRRRRSSSFSEMEKHWEDEDEPEYDLVYEIPLDSPSTIYQAGMRWWLSPDRITDWTVASVEIAEGINLSEDMVHLPDKYSSHRDCNEDGVLYTFINEEAGSSYLAWYCWQERTLSVIAEKKLSPYDIYFDNVHIYKDKVYYSSTIWETIHYKEWQNGQEQIVEAAEKIGIALYRINPDGTDREKVFEYLLPEAEQKIWEERPAYLSVTSEISGDEIVAEIYIGDRPHPFYRMNPDGSNVQYIGEILD